MANIDHEALKAYADLFSERVIEANQFLERNYPDQTEYDFTASLDFHEGFIKLEEGYKAKAVGKKQKYLNTARWDDKAVESGLILEEIMALIYDNDLSNLVDWRDKDKVKTILEDTQNRIVLSDCFRGIFCHDNDMVSFQHAQNCLGDRFPVISYLFFIKDPENYLPVRPNVFLDLFRQLKINGWKKSCSWGNYTDFVSTIKDIQLYLVDYFNDETITLIDAHSFVWMATLIRKPKAEFLQMVEVHYLKDQKLIKKANDAIEKIAEELNEDIQSLNLEGSEKEAIIKARVNQGMFRNLLLERYDRCCLCNVQNRSLLLASHIQPWAVSTSSEKLDRDNGLLLCPNHDRLFDRGYISFADTGDIVISEELDEADRTSMNIRSDMKIRLTEGNKRYLRYHREFIYKDTLPDDTDTGGV